MATNSRLSRSIALQACLPDRAMVLRVMAASEFTGAKREWNHGCFKYSVQQLPWFTRIGTNKPCGPPYAGGRSKPICCAHRG